MSQKIGAGHGQAMARLGLRELRSSMYTGSNVAQNEYGVFGSMTPGEVADQRRDDGEAVREDSGQESSLDRRLEQLKSPEMSGREDMEIEME